MRILHVTAFYEPAWAYGGMARCSAALCRALVRRGHEVTVATARWDAGHPLEETLGGVHVRRFPSPSLPARFLVPWPGAMGSFLDHALTRADVVHVHGHRNGLAVATARAMSARRRGWVFLSNGTFPHHGQRRLAKAIFDRVAGDAVVAGASALVAVSEAEARDLPRPARVIPNGVDPCGRAVRTRAGGRPRVLFVGTGRFQKRGHLLPDVMAGVPEAELQLVGPFERHFVAQLEARGARVACAGVLSGDALASAYADADVLVHPAVGEAFGLVPFEAALAGTASVVAGGHGCGEWFGRAGGCVVPPDDVAALREAVAARLRDPAQGAREAAAVAAFARAQLTWDAVAERMEAVYDEVRG